MFEVAVWLVVTLYSTDKPRGQTVYEQQFSVAADAPDLAIDDCGIAAAAYLRKAMRVNRGDWMLDVACQVRHEEAMPASGRK